MKLLCLDSNSIINRAFYGIKLLTTKDGTYTNAVYGFMNILQKLLADVQPDCVMCAFDLKAPTFRHKMFDGYKSQRKGMPAELAQQLPIVKELLTYLGYKIITKEGFEADDILGTFSAICEKSGDECFIATGDRDSLQLIGKHTTVLLASSKMGKTETVLCDETYFKEKYGTVPKRLVDIKALMGDSSDNIPGVAGIGEKTALKLVAQYGTLDKIYEHIDTVDVSNSMREKLIKGKESAYLSYDLAKIDRAVPLDCTVLDCKPAPIMQQEAFSLLMHLEMPSVVKKLGINGTIMPDDESAEAMLPLIVKNSDLELEAFLQKAEELFFITEHKNEEIISLAVHGDNCIYFFDNNFSDFKQILKNLFSLNKPKITYDCKFLYGWCFRNNCELVNIAQDVMLSGYLLSANSTDYEISSLKMQFYLRQPEIASLEIFAQNQQQILENCAVLPSLSGAIKKEILENEQEPLLNNIELPLAKVLASMEHLGFLIDAEKLTEYGKMLDQKIDELQGIIYNLAGEKFNINSPKQLGELLFDRLGLPAKKRTKTGYSTNVDVLESLRGKHEIIDGILEYRKLSKLKSTYVDGLLKEIGSDGRIHTHFNQTDTRTGRLSSTEPNLQNIPVRTELGSRLRAFFQAKEACLLVDADYSQIELRVLAHIANDENMIEAFNSGEDIHTNTAAQVFNLPPLFVTPEMRRKAKAVNFGIVYGIGAYSLSQDIGVSLSEADRYIKQYLQTYSGVKRYMDDTILFAKENGYISTLSGRRRILPEIASTNKNIASFGQRVAMNTPIQGTAADIIKIAMIRVYNRLKAEKLEAKLILQIHDELIVEAPEDEVEQVAQILRYEMEAAMSLRVKLTADVHSAKTWLDAK